ncbi:uncharacterized protein LOC113335482 [Papaver somniferum]|uniref:uncharacterized protein LOC113335482 n=1 Tax=Papaver somniferum TaxID=3469 RepID=UPI000E702BDA|nr:uncharacterized protein LOC113335482 [Papaver somniferum]XP_026437306.1 uncharacterized protein LOC113335482 [Papaver somniferum]XP_026437307.1 uncharacterized protein LOC113335482 [Papaver somniferum]XP_026437308.1 uncharacterized protein LOC113335482 [Papaver somniferum]XP_026437309.1 uncharacterized protein LOC113335482 [Papaver somniferum]
MFGFSYGEVFLLIGATAALIGPKDLPRIARTAGRLTGRAIAYVQMGRGQLDNILQQSQARQVHKELQDTLAQLEAIHHEVRSLSMLNPGPLTRRLGNMDPKSPIAGNDVAQRLTEENAPANTIIKECNSTTLSAANLNVVAKGSSSKTSTATNLQSQAAAYSRLAESKMKGSGDAEKLKEEIGLLAVLPVSAEGAGLLPKTKGDANGSDIMLEAILEAEVAENAKKFFEQQVNQIPS